MVPFLVAFIVSMIGTLLVVRYEHLHMHVTADNDLVGIQKFHYTLVSRVGGIGVMVGVLSGIFVYFFLDPEDSILGLIIIVAAIPAFAAGLIEDLTKTVGVRERLIATAFSASLGGLALGGWLPRFDVAGLDYLMAFGVISVLVTCVAVAGVANAFNIIDGYNGLAGMVGVIILCGIAYVSNQIGDVSISTVALVSSGSILGFLVWNYPRGLIFLGDGGAYLVGFLVAELSVLLVTRNPQVTPWFPFLLSAYPIYETIFTIFRRVIIAKKHPGLPDAVHLHQLVHSRLVRWGVGSKDLSVKRQRNSLTAPYLWMFTLVSVVLGILFWDQTGALKLIAVLLGLAYIYIYAILYKRKFPNWLVIRSRK